MLGDRSYGDTNPPPPIPAPVGTVAWWNQKVDPYNFDSIVDPNISIQYHASAINADTGATIPCDGTATIQEGTRVRFVFEPHTPEDIYWFATGAAFDSPYGEWIAGAAKPAANMCTYLPQKDFIVTQHSKGLSGQANVTGNIYVSLVGNPPAKDLEVTGSVGNCTTVGSNKTCTASSVGTISARFNFAPTTGIFYGRNSTNRGCFTSNRAMQSRTRNAPVRWREMSVAIPKQTISCSIKVAEKPVENPSVPTITATSQCVVGTPHTLSITGTDPSGGAIRYAIDWDVNGSIDEYIPPTGYVPSGTAKNAQRTYSATGQQSVRARTENQAGAHSAWKTYTFACENPKFVQCPRGWGRDPLRNNTCHVLCPGTQNFAPGDNVNNCPSQCLSSQGAPCAFNVCGMAGGTVRPNCSCSGSPPPDSLCSAAPRILTWLVRPLLLQSGNPTFLTWSTRDVSSCSVTGTNGDGKQGTSCPSGWCETSGTHVQSGPIRGQTTYTLSCVGDDNSTVATSTTVNIIPVFREN